MKRTRTKSIPRENETVEWKQSLGEWKEVVETCAAFATAKGGTIYIGVAPDGNVAGIQVGKGSLEDLANKIVQNTSPRLVPTICTIRSQGKTLIKVHVGETPSKPVYAFDRPYRRSGRTNQRLAHEDAFHLFMDSRGLTWDTTIVEDSTLEDVDEQAIEHFLQLANAERRWNVNPNTPAEKVLKQLGLCREGKLTVAGLALFGRNPQQLMTQAMLRCARFKGNTELHFIDMKVIEGNIIDQVDQAMTFIERNIRMGAEIKGLRRKDVWEYPLDALREALVNAVCHRDYASSANVQVRIFDNRLEVWNPGELPPGLTVADLRKEHDSKPRNRLIAHAFFLIKYVEQFGTGTRRMIDDCLSYGLPEPQFQSRSGTFVTVFRQAERVTRPRAESGAELPAESMLQALRSEPLSSGEWAKVLGRKTVTGAFKRSVRDLLAEGLVERTIPDKPKSRLQKYRLTDKGCARMKRA